MILVGAFFALYFTVLQPNENSVAINSTNKEGTDYENIGELLNDKTTAEGDKPFNGTILNKLITKIDSTATCVSDLVSKVTSTSGKTATDIRKNNGGKSLVVKLGDLDWIVTYVTLDSTSSNVIATLWLSNNHQTAWGWDGTTVGNTALTNPTNVGSYCAIINGGLYSDWSANWYCNYSATGINYPSNMYGTSYIRTETLNNPTNRYVATGTNNTTTDVTLDKTTWETQQEAIYDPKTGSGHPFALFTVDRYGLTSHIVKPSQMTWMQSEKSYPNESTNEDVLYSDKEDKSCYYWKNDYLWLPSLSETGYDTTDTGIWKLNNAERSTYDGSTTASSSSLKAGSNNDSEYAYVYSWSRSADDYSNARDSYFLTNEGDHGFSGNVVGVLAVRPALLLNLTSAASTIPINITLDQQSGSGGTSTVSATKGLAMSTITVPTRTGYVFGGYYTGQNGTGTQYYTAIGTSARTCDLTSVTTLYAYWLVWYEIASVTGTTTEYTIIDGARSGYKFWDLMITPASGNVISQFSFDNKNWFAVDSCSKEFYNTSAALVVRCLANENSNAMSLMFEGVIATETIQIYLQTVSGAYLGLKATGGVTGVNVSATYGGSATLVGDDYDNLNDADTITVSAKVTKTGYKFSKWVDSDGKTLSTNSSERFAKSLVMDSIITAVFEAEVNEHVNYELDNM